MCSDAPRSAGTRSSGGYWPPFSADTAVFSPTIVASLISLAMATIIFGGARRVTVHQQNDSTVKRLFAEPLSLEDDGLLCHHCEGELQRQEPQCLGR